MLLILGKCNDLTSIDDFYLISYDSGTCFTAAEYVRFQEVIVEIGNYHHGIRAICEARRFMVCQIKPKAHYLQHLATQGKLINPRAVQTYRAESFVGFVVNIWKGSVSGPYRRVVQRLVCIIFLVALLCELEKP